ncbi:MAG TPA: TPM domain-containing protein [Chryseolinea sp.]
MNIKKRFSDSDLQRIKDAVKLAEEKISGEIVPVIVERSGRYLIANYKGSLIGASLAFMTMIVLDRYIISNASNTLFYDPVFIFFIVILGGVVGALIPHFSEGARRLLLSQVYMDHTTRQRAENAFLEEEVFNTRQRTGIMIFISFFEHEVMVMADRGISKVVEQKQWDMIVADIVAQIRAGHAIEGLEAGIRRCGDLLLEKGFKKTDDDINELSDDLRVN